MSCGLPPAFWHTRSVSSWRRRPSSGATWRQRAVLQRLVRRCLRSVTGRLQQQPIDRVYYQLDANSFAEGTQFSIVEGRHTLKFYSVDKVGNIEAEQSLSVNVDKTPPSVQVVTEQATYTRVTPFVVHYSAADPYPGSGIAAMSAILDGVSVLPEQTVDLFWKNLGTYTVIATADDVAGWRTVNQAPFQLVANTQSLLATVAKLCTMKEIGKAGLCNSLTQKLEASLRQQQAGNIGAAANQLDAFIHEVEAQTGKGITERASNILLMDAQYSKAHLIN
jgi:hypothetical protein